MELAKTVALGELGRELAGLVAGASWAGQAAILGRARMLLEKLYHAPAEVAPAQEPAGTAAEWQAVRLADTGGQGRSSAGAKRTMPRCGASGAAAC